MGSARTFVRAGNERKAEAEALEEPKTESRARRPPAESDERRETSETRIVLPGVGRVLLVDDHAELRRVWTRALRRVGHEVVEAGSGEEALERLSTTAFDLVVSDVQMPDMNGIELLAELRRVDPVLPVLLLSGAPDLETVARANQLGVLEFLMKPVDLGRLVTTVSRGVALTHARHGKGQPQSG